jgi:hypothetical protein
MSDPQQRRRWISFGELIAVAALLVSALGVWVSWKSVSRAEPDKPTRIVEQRQAIPLVLRGRVSDEGRAITVSPVEESHTLESLTISFPQSGSSIDIGPDGEFSARAVENAINDADRPKGNQRTRVRISARYVEAGSDKRATGAYVLTYRWEGGGLFSGRSLRLVELRRG